VGYDIKRQPGQWALEEAAHRGRRILIGLCLFFALDALVFLLAFGQWFGFAVSFAFLAVVVGLRRPAERYADRYGNWLHGGRAEEAVGTTLAELRRDGWIVMHDITKLGGGNIDHIASGPRGVYLIETKLRRYEDEHLGKAKRQAAKLRDELGVWVTPVICLHRRASKPFRSKGVWVVPRTELLEWLRSQRNVPVDFERLARFADSL